MGNVTNLGKDSNGNWVPMGAGATASGEWAGLVSAGLALSLTYADATYTYYCAAAIGSTRTDAAWLITRVAAASSKETDYAGVAARVTADDVATVAAHSYNNGVAL